MGLLRRAYSALFWAFLVVTSVLLFPVAVTLWACTAPFDRRKVLLHRFTCCWAALYTWCSPLWPVRISGRERIDDDTPVVMVANHLSLLDILVLFRLFRHFTWVSKRENFSVPFIGWNMRLNGYIPLTRGDRGSARRMMAACERALARGESVMIFPEGTRSRDGRLRPFKRGAFEIALRAQVPVQPIVITGTAEALPKRGFVLHGRHPIGVEVLEPITPVAFRSDDADDVAEQVRAVFLAQLGEADRR